MGILGAAVDLTAGVVDWARELGAGVLNAPGSGSGPGGGNYGGAGASGAGGGGGSGPGRRGPRPPTLGELMDLFGEATREVWDLFWEGVSSDPDSLTETMEGTGRNAALELQGQRMGNTGLTTVVGTGIDALTAGPKVYEAADAAQRHNRRNEERGLGAIARERDLRNPSGDTE